MKDMASLCEQCGKTFVAGNRLKAHIENVHENNKKFICKICKIAFQNIYKLNYHQFKHTDVRTFQCNECDRKFKNRSDLYQHYKIHDKNKTFKCQQCGENIQKRSTYELHIRKNECLWPGDTCKLCNKVFNRGYTIKEHMIKFHGIGRIFKCKHCPELEMETREAYNSHRKTHKVTLSCNLCDKSFVRNYHLKRHLVTHETIHVKREKQISKKKVKHFNKKEQVDFGKLPEDGSFISSIQEPKKDVIKTIFGKKEEDETEVFAIELTISEKEDANPLMLSTDDLEIKIEIGAEEVQEQEFEILDDQKRFSLKDEITDVIDVKEEPIESLLSEILPMINEREESIANSIESVLDDNLTFKSSSNHKNVHKTDKKPKKKDKLKEKIDLFCQICNKVVTRLAEHQKRMHNKQLDFKCERCGKAFPFNYELERHHKRHNNCISTSNSKLFQCGLCEGKYSSRKSLVHHVRALHNERINKHNSLIETKDSDDEPLKKSLKNNHVCQYCSSAFNTFESLSDHLLKHHSSTNLACEFCDKSFILFTKLETHRMIHHYEVKYLPCSVLCCNFKCPTRAEMKQHTLKTHDKECKFDCFACDLTFVHSATLRQHRIDMHDLEPESPIDSKVNGLTCSQCNKVFASRDTLRLHISSIHKKNECFKCLICLEGFRTTDIRKRHLTKVHQDGAKMMRTCGLCGADFKLAEEFYQHISAHVGAHICKICGENLNDSFQLRTHQKIHRKIDISLKKIVCDLCGLRFLQKGLLRTHMYHHIEGKFFICEECGKSFKFQSTLAQHKKIHNRQIECDVCKKMFATNQALEVHSRTHSGYRPYECKYKTCKKKFSAHVTMSTHLKMHHNPFRTRDHPCFACEHRSYSKADLRKHISQKHADC